MSTVNTTQLSQFYPILQPTLTEIQNIVSSGTSTNAQQSQAVAHLANQSTAETTEYKNQLAATLQDQASKYVDLSQRLNDYNEIYNTNAYIAGELHRGEKGMNHTTKQLKNSIYISKQQSVMYEYQKNKLQFYKGLFLVSCFVIIDMLTVTGVHLNGLITSKMLYIVAGVSAVVYLCVVFFLVYSNSYRSHTDWNKYDWSSLSSTNQQQTSCPAMPSQTLNPTASIL